MPSYFDQLPKESFENSTRHYFKSPLTFSSTQPSSADESSTLGIMITQQVTGSIITIDDEECIVFYQAYNSGIADWVVKNQTFDECPNFDKKRMSWIKPNYLWMMYRSEYATAKNQTNILALFITRKSFEEELLKHAVCAMYYPELEGYYKSQKEWKVNCSQMKEKVAQLMNKNDTDTIMTDNVCFARVQWDPYHTPAFGNINGGLTRAIQIGVKGSFLRSMCKSGACKKIEDITKYVHEQHAEYLKTKDLLIPVERYIHINDKDIKGRLAITDL
ncbi:predicted protein [Naegleria gruberi]|uniref:Predicted protein n=1 Tax=Naegleria gruberi TaxID=5762 RepID=D2W0E5_NAEGR|nr:uncharacterized protein NAEGRDRAFT_74830 [Naegleria gruberi]EFC37460.1 predicted protein [Naegleria gruberi]|eukprot:XP_002670204.1 predicted protein [Naegleria gruberi strain NEG-M]